MNKKGSNIFTSFLNALNVKYTEAFSNKYFNEHPHKYNLFGISKMLDNYGVENAGTKIEDKVKDLFNVQTPFIAHAGGDFVTVYKVSEENVEYRWNGKDISVAPTIFCNSWTGIVLLAEPNSNSIEPNYKENKEKELFNKVQQYTLLLAFGSLVTIALVNNQSYFDIGIIISFIINFIGAYIGFLLVQKQFNIQSNYSDKICSLFKQADCNNILETSAAKLWGIFGWSEIGFSYFISNIIILSIFPNQINYYAIINICALPYSFWSIWYQKYKAKQWCTLCLIVQILLWGIFFTNLGFNNINVPSFDLIKLAIIALIYFISFILINLFVPLLLDRSKIEKITQEINSIKADEDVFLTLLRKQPNYKVDKSTSNILWGNPDANILITIFTNPHCNPCAKMHAHVEELLNQTDDLCIQYIFSSFDKSLDFSNKFLSAIYLNNSIEEAKEVYSEWFEKGKLAKEDFFKKYDLNIENEDIQDEFQRHEIWKEQTGLRATPTILVNGYKLPDNYKIEDLKYFTYF